MVCGTLLWTREYGLFGNFVLEWRICDNIVIFDPPGLKDWEVKVANYFFRDCMTLDIRSDTSFRMFTKYRLLGECQSEFGALCKGGEHWQPRKSPEHVWGNSRWVLASEKLSQSCGRKFVQCEQVRVIDTGDHVSVKLTEKFFNLVSSSHNWAKHSFLGTFCGNEVLSYL